MTGRTDGRDGSAPEASASDDSAPDGLSDFWRAPLSTLRQGVVVLTVVALAAAVGWGAIAATYGSLAHGPIAGNTDQVDFTLMAWTWAEHGQLGTVGGGPVVEEVLAADVHRGGVAQSASAAPDALRDQRPTWARLVDESDDVSAYSYRAPAYPILLGTVWRVTGAGPESGPVVNLVLHVMAVAVLTAGLGRQLSLLSGVVSGLVLTVAPAPLYWAGQNMSETLSVLLASTSVVLSVAVVKRPGPVRLVSLAVVLALLGLTKQMFIPIGLVSMLAVFALAHRPRPRPLVREGAAKSVVTLATAASVFGLILLPWFAYNANTTGSWAYMTGTAGWHDMAASYSRAYLSGENRVAVREKHFNRFERLTGRSAETGPERAAVGRQMWFSQFRQGEYWPRLPALMVHKTGRSLGADVLGWSVRLLALGAVVMVVWRGSSQDRRLLAAICVMPVVLMAFIALTVEAGPRLLVTTWVAVGAVIGLAAHVLSRERSTGARSPDAALAP